MLFDFNKKSSLSNWYIVDDVVMGGRSSGYLKIDDDGHGRFGGNISLRNNGVLNSIFNVSEKPCMGDLFIFCPLLDFCGG